MKKIVVNLSVFILLLSMMVTSLTATTIDEQVQASYRKVKSYYENEVTSLSVDNLIAAEALGIEVEGKYTFNTIVEGVSKDMQLNALAKSIIALSQMSMDLSDVNGVDMIALLESCVQEDGSVVKSGYQADPNVQVWVLFALEVVNSEKIEKVAEHLASTQLDDGGFPISDYYTKDMISDPDTTGWCIEALTIANKTKYQASLEKAIQYLKTNQDVIDGHWGSWGLNTSSQASVLEGLVTYDKASILNGDYDVNGNNPYMLMIGAQNSEKGYFETLGYTSGELEFDPWGTYQAGISLGCYVNGSFVLNARNEYTSFLNKEVTQEQVKEVESDKAPATKDNSNIFKYLNMLVFASLICLCYKNSKRV